MLLKSKSIAAATALSLTLGAALPAHAWGRSEQNALKAIAAALVVGAIVHQSQKKKAEPQPAPQPVYRQPVVKAPAIEKPVVQKPVYQESRNQTRYDHDSRIQAPAKTYQQPQVKTGRVIGQTTAYGSGIQNTTAAQVFNNYAPYQRVAIQRRLSEFGYYNGTLDGAFGPRTHQALYEFARTAGKQDALGNAKGASQVYNALLG
jgi:hypothetical protein